MFEDKIGFIAALPAEATTVRRHCGHLEDRVLVANFGIGPQAATAAAESLVDKGASLLVSWGTGGGLERGVKSGTVILCRTVVDLANEREHTCDARTINQFANALKPLSPMLKRGLSCTEPIADDAEKLRLHRRYDSALVDMESAAIGAVAQATGTAFAVVRVIVDPAHFSLPASALAGLGPSQGQLKRTLFALIGHPSECGAMIRLGTWYFYALRRLSEAARLILTSP